MSVKGITRYQRLIQNITNWQEYAFRKGERKKRSLQFTTKPYPIHFKVPDSLYQVFKEIFMEDFYEINSLVKKLPSNPVVIDVGANAGFFNILLFSKIHKARVLAYEPMPSNIHFFKEAIDRNPILQSIKLYQAAVTGEPKEYIELFTEDTEENTVVASIFSDFDERNTKKACVQAESLTHIINKNRLEQIDLLKLDCEGSEYEILYNTSLKVLDKIKMMVIEVHEIDSNKNNLKSLTNFLHISGYQTTAKTITSTSYYLQAIKV